MVDVDTVVVDAVVVDTNTVGNGNLETVLLCCVCVCVCVSSSTWRAIEKLVFAIDGYPTSFTCCGTRNENGTAPAFTCLCWSCKSSPMGMLSNDVIPEPAVLFEIRVLHPTTS